MYCRSVCFDFVGFVSRILMFNNIFLIGLTYYKFEIETTMNLTGSDADANSESDTEMPHNGLMSVLKEYQSGQYQKAEPKAAPKAAAKRTAAPKASRNAKLSASAAQPIKTTVGTADIAAKRRKINETPSSEPKASMSLGLGEEMCDADKEVCTNFQCRLDDLRNVKAPIPDAQFKSYMSDLLSKANAFWTDLKTKRRSLSRRNNKDDLLTNAIDGMEVDIKGFLHILKCHFHLIY